MRTYLIIIIVILNVFQNLTFSSISFLFTSFFVIARDEAIQVSKIISCYFLSKK